MKMKMHAIGAEVARTYHKIALPRESTYQRSSTRFVKTWSGNYVQVSHSFNGSDNDGDPRDTRLEDIHCRAFESTTMIPSL